ncbi:hypothetical protein DOTSEDRAFT_152345, partial [Dothistroma septosporum NZE10]
MGRTPEAQKMLRIHCSGTPHEIGFKHGQEAREPIVRTIVFYTGMFQHSCKKDWQQVQDLALRFEPSMRKNWPAYLEEMRGIAAGAQLPLSSILAINVRTEIAFGAFSDGCTALSWQTSNTSWLAQNWDWDSRQQENLIQLTIEQIDKPTIKMITEAGLIGKIGLNSAGVGVCLNAIKAKGMDPTRLPCHLGLRMVLESTSRDDAVKNLETYGIASPCHMLVADASGGIGLEWSSIDLKKIEMNSKQQVFHTNHYLTKHKGVHDEKWLKDSDFRVTRVEQLCGEIEGEPSYESILRIFQDTKNHPGSICRAAEEPNSSATLFNIIMALDIKVADVNVGRPDGNGEGIVLVL